MAFEKETFYGSAKVYIAGFHVGNVPSLTHTIETEEKSIPSRLPGGGKYDSLTIVNAVSLAMTLSDYNDDNLALALQALKIETSADTAITGEKQTAPAPGGLVPLDAFVKVGEAVQVQDDAQTPQTFTAGTDYEVTQTGIKVLEGGAITEGTTLVVDYVALGSTSLEMLAGTQKAVPVLVEGINEAQSGQPFNILYHSVKIAPSASFGAITDGYGSIELPGEALPDQTKGAGKSKFMRMVKAPSVKA
ncbi:MAG: hypothetical protein CMB99_16400 [Flavobacteriaceae bacterium]|nr:hypothetical protein [Flavobacteriaceae bacterium]|tara:strand:- start:30627 stop:31367 length:741 start_codon:yes stop_codon:yes gene_type:complete